jgi:hypothetical protein
VSQQLVPPPWTGGQDDWHCESDVQLPHEPPLPPDDEPLLLLLVVPLLLPLLPELLLLTPPLLDPLLLLLKPPLLLPELLPLLLLEPPSSLPPKGGELESPDPHAAAANAKETARALNVASFMSAFLP